MTYGGDWITVFDRQSTLIREADGSGAGLGVPGRLEGADGNIVLW